MGMRRPPSTTMALRSRSNPTIGTELVAQPVIRRPPHQKRIARHTARQEQQDLRTRQFARLHHHPPYANPRCNASAPIDSPVSSMPWPRRGTYTRLHRHHAARNAVSASRERCTGTTSSASPCTISTGARLASSAARASGATSAPENARIARGARPAQAGEQHRHRALAEPHHRVGLRRQPEPRQFRIDERVEDSRPLCARPPPSPRACDPQRSTTAGRSRNHAETAHRPRRTARPAPHATKWAPGRSGRPVRTQPVAQARQAASSPFEAGPQ